MNVQSLTFIRAENFVEKLVLRKSFWLVFVLGLFIYPIYRSVNRKLPPPLPVLKELPVYQLKNSFNKPFGSNELLGRYYVANFIFTSCTSSCPRLTKVMETIQKRVRGLGTKVALVSFSVDPDNDSPDVLFKYARKMNANPYIWTFLTGPQDELKKIVEGGFSTIMGEREKVEGILDGGEVVSMMDIAHSEKFALVDEKGRLRGYYDSTTNEINRMMIDIGLLVNQNEYGND